MLFPAFKFEEYGIPGWLPTFEKSASTYPPSPQTPEAGGSYYIGDIYEQSRIGQSGEIFDNQYLPFKPSAPYVQKPRFPLFKLWLTGQDPRNLT